MDSGITTITMDNWKSRYSTRSGIYNFGNNWDNINSIYYVSSSMDFKTRINNLRN